MRSFGKNVMYISKQMGNVDTNQDKFFPFMNSPLIHSTAMNQFSIKNLHAMCNLTNIRNHIPHKQEVQQFVFFGRSNVGKSSLINTLIRKDYVETSKKPGKTKQLAFLNINSTLRTYLVDAPGYGYASDASKHDILQWGRLIEYYLKNTPTNDNQIILVLLDILHGVKDTDAMLLKMLKSLKKNFMLVYTKCDRAGSKQRQQSVKIAKQIQQKFSSMNFYVHFTSARENIGISELKNHLMYRIAVRQLTANGGSTNFQTRK